MPSSLQVLFQVQPFTETPGPVHQLEVNATPLDFLGLCWDPSFFDLLADETNQYAQLKQVSKPDTKWYPCALETLTTPD